MTGRLAIYAPNGIAKSLVNMFGKDVANLRLFQALAQSSGFEELGILTQSGQESNDDSVTALLQGRSGTTRIWTDSILRPAAAARAGAVLRGLPALDQLAWLRQRASERAYSLIGLVHTLAPPAVRDQIADLVTAPTRPWDALICPSPVVQTQVRQLFDAWSEQIAARFGGKAPPPPQYALIPLGVDYDALAAAADRPDVRAAARERLGIGPDDCLVLWVGRLSFFEKAFPQPMLRAVQEARARSRVRLHFVMLGWFPGGDRDRAFYQEAIDAYAPDVSVHILDGNDQTVVGEMWAASDIFLSLVDNIQETFGLTPLEAMAAGRPIVASDWDGYRYTVRDGIEGFLVPTLIPPVGFGSGMVDRHMIGRDNYQTYVGTVAQFTAVDVGKAADALARLIADPDLRRRMGQAGRDRVRTTFDWPVVARQIHDLVQDLAQRRAEGASSGDVPGRHVPPNPITGDPFGVFASFATSTLSKGHWITLRDPGPGDPRPILARCQLDRFGAAWRLTDEQCGPLLARLGDGNPHQMRDILADYPAGQHVRVVLTVVWMCKLGILSDG